MDLPKFAIIDAYSLLYRAFFALPPTMSNNAGEVTNAVYGFTTMLVRLLDSERPEALAVAFDMPEATFRHEAFEAYKAHRKPMPDDLRPQIQMTRDVLEAMRIPIIGVPGFEADDVIGTLSRQAADAGYRVLIVTGDRDALQLVNEQVQVLATKRGITDTILFDPPAVFERYGIAPAQVPDMKALVGDASDNIPGVPGIGEKTASKLIAEYGSLEALLARSSEVKGKVGASLATYADQARQSKQLATIHCEVPLGGVSLDSCRQDGWDLDKVEEVFRRLGFHSLLGRLQTSEPQVTPVGESLLFHDTRCLESTSEVQALARALRELGACTLAPVSSGDDALRDELVGLAISAGDQHVYLPLQTAPPQQSSLFEEESAKPPGEALLALLAPVMEDAAVSKQGYDMKLLYLWFQARGIRLAGVNFDALLAGYLLDPTRRHELPDLVYDYLHQRVELPSLTSLWRSGELGELARAAGQRAQLIHALQAPLRVGLEHAELLPLLRDVEMPLIPVLAEMEWLGIGLDRAHLEDLSLELGKTIHQLEGEIYRMAGEEFTINSPKQLQVILFEKLALQKGRKTKTGYSTDAETLAALADKHEIVQKLLQYRELTKLKSTYVDSLPRLIHPRDGRIHTHFNQAVTATGRLSSTDPNLQNIPIRTEEGREIRRAFIPAESGWRLLAADYSQIELRVLAHFTQDEALIEVFRRGEDLHTATACRVFDVAPEQVTREMRRMAKVVNFSIPYGTTAFGLAGQLGVPRAMAEELMRTYLTRFPGVDAYMKRIVEEARAQGFVVTLLGRRRPLPDLHAGNPNIRQAAERTAINTPIQGSAADIMKLSMLRLQQALQMRSDLHARLLLQVHDEMVLETPENEVESVAEILRDAMRHAYPLAVPLEVEVKVGPNWRDVSPRVEDIPLEPATD